MKRSLQRLFYGGIESSIAHDDDRSQVVAEASGALLVSQQVQVSAPELSNIEAESAEPTHYAETQAGRHQYGFGD